MSQELYQQAKKLLLEAVGLEPDERQAWLERVCADTPALRDEVDSLLAFADVQDDAFSDDALDRGRDWLVRALHPSNGSSSFTVPAELPETVGPYRITRMLGAGGMGIVYEAQQPRTRRRVAVKVVRPDLLNDRALRRFQLEAELMAQLRHRGIAQIYEFNVAEVAYDGLPPHRHPFFAMELIEGQSLFDYSVSQRLDRRAVLGLFCSVCDAVDHAHRKGIIHRDLKPGNILVDADGQPKVLDFGAARATDALAVSATAHTVAGQIVGTLAYMSPEQLAGDTEAVDVRSDVYALGAILYELLTGRLPIDVSDAPLPAAIRTLSEARVPRASAVRGDLRGDLDAILAKAIHKDPECRYASAAELAADVRRHLSGEAIAARRDSALYVLGKTVRRHRWTTAAIATAVVGLVAIAFYADTQSRRFARLAAKESAARREAEAAQSIALAAEGKALAQQRHAVREADRASLVTEYMLETIALADPDVSHVSDLRVRDMLDLAAQRAEDAFTHDPPTAAAMHTVIGRAYASLGALDEAEYYLHQALRIRDEQVPRDLEKLYEILWPYAHVLNDLSDVTAPIYWNRLRDMPSLLLAQRHPQLGSGLHTDWPSLARSDNATDVEQHIAELIRIVESTLAEENDSRVLLADHFYLVARCGYLPKRGDAACLYLQEALSLQRRELPETDTRIIRTLGQLIRTLRSLGRYDEAAATAREAIELRRRILPDQHWHIALFEGRLGTCLLGQERFEEAAEIMERSLEQIVASCGITHYGVLEILPRLIAASEATGKYERADAHRRMLAAAAAGLHQSGHPWAETAFASTDGALWEAMLDLRVAIREDRQRVPELLAEVCDLRAELLPDDHELSALFVDVMSPWINAYINDVGFNEHSLRGFSALHSISRVNEHLHPHKRAAAAFWVSWNLEAMEDYEAGAPLAREAVAMAGESRAKAYGRGGITSSLLGGHLLGLERFDEAEPWLIEGLQLLLESEGAADGNTTNAWERLVRLYVRWERSELLIPYLRDRLATESTAGALNTWAAHVILYEDLANDVYQEALELAQRAESLAPDSANALSTLGAALYRVGEYEPAMQALKQAEQIRTSPQPWDFAFSAMTLHRLGRDVEAAQAVAHLRTLLDANSRPGRSDDLLLAEAERTLLH